MSDLTAFIISCLATFTAARLVCHSTVLAAEITLIEVALCLVYATVLYVAREQGIVS